jgi:hypothetical protein
LLLFEFGIADLSGTWQSNFGLSYIINQFGNAITIQEVHPVYGITAVGQGVISQGSINISYVNAFYARGTGMLQLNNYRQMNGQFTDLATGFTTYITLYR